MFSSARKSIPFLIIKGRDDGNVERGITDMSWTSLVRMMSKHEVRTNKNGLSIIPARFKPKDQWVLTPPREDYTPTYRNQENVEAITIAIIDVDQEGGIEAAKEVLAGYEFFIYSTHSYSISTPYKFRVVIRLNEPIPVENWPLAFACLLKNIDADKQCGNADRLYYLPAISPNAGISQVFEHFRGKTMAYEDILKLGGDNPDELLKSKIQERRSRRHFAGQDVATSLTIADQLEWTWEFMSNRLSSRVEKLKESDSRHGFALTTVSDEIRRAKENVNLGALISFIYKASYLYSSKPITMGNTPGEIPEFVESAFRKLNNGDECIRKFEELNGMRFRDVVNKAISNADLSQATQNWAIDQKITFVSEKSGAPSLFEMRMLQRENMQELVKNCNGEEYVKNCLLSYISSSFEFKADTFAQFIVGSYGSYLDKYDQKSDKKTAVEKLITVDYSGILEGKKGAEFARFIRPSLRKACLNTFEQSLVMAI